MTQAALLDTATYPRLTDLDSVIEACGARDDVQPFARIVGRWVWCEFPSKPSADVRDFLKGTGFRWNQTRNAWQHNCGYFTRANRKIDPRAVYGQTEIKSDYVTREQAGPAPDRLAQELHNFQAA
jgi:hypothetical protein